MLTKKEDILSELKKIHTLEQIIERRILRASSKAYDTDAIILSEENINTCTEKLADQLVKELPHAYPILITIMNGGMPFAQKLNNALANRGYNFTPDSMHVSSYHGTKSSGKVMIKADPKTLVGGRTVIFVDDVCDTGNTYKALKDLFELKGATDIRLMVLVDKKQERAQGCNPDYAGFELSKEDFIIGMGLDYNGGQRNLPFINIVDLASLPTAEEQTILDRKPFLNTQLQECVRLERMPKVSENPEAFFVNSTPIELQTTSAPTATL